MAQYGPGEGGYMSFRFEGQVVGAVSCEHRGTDTLRCRVREGTSGHVELRAAVNPPALLEIRLLSAPPGWPGLSVASGYGTASAEYRFALPRGSAGRRFELVFGAFCEGALVSSLTVILEVEWPPSPFPVTTVPVYVTDREGRFTIPVGELSDTVVRGTIACDGKPKSGVQVSAKLIPREGRGSIRTLTDVGGVELSSPDFGTIKIPRERLRFSSSFDITGRIQRTIDVGTVCLKLGEIPYAKPITSDVVSGKTGRDGELSLSLDPRTRVTARLIDCEKGNPLAGVTVRLSPIYEQGELTGFEISPEGYASKAVTEIFRFSMFNTIIYNLGEVCFSPPTLEKRCKSVPLKIFSLNAQRLTITAKAVKAREQEIMKFIKRGQFDIVCLQEWFQDVDVAGVTGLRAWSIDKKALLRSWIGANPNLEEIKVTEKRVSGIRLINAYPNNYGAEIVLGPNYIAGPDCTRFLEKRLDGGLVILVRSPYKIIAASAFLFSNSEDWDAHASKGALYARVQLDPNDPQCYIHIFNTHLQADYPGKNYAKIRAKQLEELITFISKCVSDDSDKHPILLIGDFNIIAPRPKNWGKNLDPPQGMVVNTTAPTKSNEYILLTQQLQRWWGLTDAWASLRPGDPGFTWIGKDWGTRFPSPWGNLGNTLATEGGWPARLDYMFVYTGGIGSPIKLQLQSIKRSPEKTTRKTNPYEWRQGDEKITSFTLSDHLGLILEMITK
jgi:endonuclease/exonuclease/phosphatase family metal-dependent hydrolase